MRRPTMGNLFSGSGAWELAAKICGIDVVFEAEIEPFPVALEAKRFPEAIQLGDVSKINGAEIPPVDILTNSSPCFAEGSLVATDSGLKDIKDVLVGDLVLTHGNRYMAVTNAGCTGTKQVFRLKAMGLDEIVCTDNHPFLVRKMRKHYPTYYLGGKKKRGNLRRFGNPEWKPLKELDSTYYIGTAINQNATNVKHLTEEEMWLIGRYIADGYRRHGQPTITFCIGYQKAKGFLAKLSKHHGYEDRQRTALKYSITDRRLHELCGDCGDTAINKTFPKWVLDLSADDLAIVIDGYMSGDGCYEKATNVFKATTISRQLAYTLGHAVAKAYRIPYCIHKTVRKPTCVIEGRVVNQHDTYDVSFRDTHKGCQAFYEDGHVWFPIRSIECVGEAPVYNLSVETDNSYTVQNVMVHNCQGLSVAGMRKGLNDERSGLFSEAIRITKEMRDASRLRSGRADDDIRLSPRFWCWENVPGALNSNGGEDFRYVIQEVARLVEENAVIPMPAKGWTYSGIVDGNGWQIAWRVMDAQYYGVAQRRRRVFLVADLDGRSAGEILFERESVSWHFAEIAAAWQDTSRSLGDRIENASRIINRGLRRAEDALEDGELTAEKQESPSVL